MDTKFQTSFIPKKPLVDTSGRPYSRPVSVFLVVAIIIFILSLGSALGVFVYKKVLIGRIANMDADLVKAKNAFEPSFLDNINKLNKRIESSKKIMDSHSAVSPLFDLFENKTLATIKFDSMNYELKDDGTASLSIAGQGKNFSSIALQSDVFGQDKNIKSPVFSDLNPDLRGNIVFKFSASLDSSLISYKNAYATAVANQ